MSQVGFLSGSPNSPNLQWGMEIFGMQKLGAKGVDRSVQETIRDDMR